MAITDRDIKKLSGIFATKDDLKAFATKDDLKAFATKDELKSLEDKMMFNFDRVFKKLEDMTIEMKISFGQYKRHDEKLENHENRIKKIEEKILA